MVGIAQIDTRVRQMQLQSLGEGLVLPSVDFGQSIGRQRVDRNEGDQSPRMRRRRSHGEGVGVVNPRRGVGQRGNHHRAFGQIGGGHHPGRIDARLVHVRQQIVGRQRLDEGRIAGTDTPRTAAIGRQDFQNGGRMDVDVMVSVNRRAGLRHHGPRKERGRNRARRDDAFEGHERISERRRPALSAWRRRVRSVSRTADWSRNSSPRFPSCGSRAPRSAPAGARLYRRCHARR